MYKRQRIGSAATAAALRYFSAYSKKIVIALTAVDRVAKNDADLNRLLARAHELYGPYVADIRPVNGSRAWEAIVSNDAAAIVDTGFLALVNSIDEICVSQGNKVRNLSRYFAIRRTERQYRSALRTLHATYKAVSYTHLDVYKRQWVTVQVKEIASEFRLLQPMRRV